MERRFGLRAAFLAFCTLAAATPAIASGPSCAALQGMAIPAAAIRLPTDGARVLSAVVRPAQGVEGTPDYLPEYCDVRGTIAPADHAAPPITFGVALPTRWNGKAIQIGGNGLLGFVPYLAALNRNGAGSPQGPTAPPDSPYPLAQGYATFGDDSGHSNGDGLPPGKPGGVPPTNGQATMGGPPSMGSFEWVANREAWINFTYAHIRKGHDAAMAVMRRMYGRTPDITYFMGESHGGREAMEAIGRYPEDYKGVLVSVPLTYLTELWVRDFRNTQALAKPGGSIPPIKLTAIAHEVVRQCDALDGRTDGVINNYLACDLRFDPSLNPHANDALRCPDGTDSGNECLSDAQLVTLNTLRSPVKLGYSLPGIGDVFPASPAGSEADGRWMLAFGPPGGFNPAVAIMRVTLGDPNLTAETFDSGKYIEPLKRMASELDPPTDWSRFFALGGKVIYHSAATDYLTNSRGHLAAYRQIVAHSGAAAGESLRFYVTPGGDHGSRSYAFPGREPQPRQMDLVGALENWVEKGQAPPDMIRQTLTSLDAPYRILAARPLCRYPAYPRWEGTARPDNMAGYVCARP